MAEGTAKTIDQLPTKQSVLGSDFIPLDDGTQSYKTTWAALLALTGGITSATASGNTLTITTQSGQTYTLTITDSSKQDVLTFDATPTDGSSNPVTSDGIYDAVHAVSVALASEASTARTAEEANARAIGILNGDETLEGSVEHTVAEAIAALIASTLTPMADDISEAQRDIGDMTTLQTSARTLVGGVNEVKNVTDKAVQFAAQTLTDAQKTQARVNIGAQVALGLYIDASGDICQI